MARMRLTTSGNYKFLTNPLDTYVGKSLEVYGEWSHGELNMISSLVADDASVIEVGSNIGAHTVFIAKEICPKGNVYAFEPRRILFQNLCANICINEISNVHAFQKALGIDHNHMREGSIAENEFGNHGAFDLGSIGGDSEEIEIVPLDSFLEKFEKISLIKADVEGYEEDVLRGSSQLIARDHPVLYLENDRILKSKSLIEYVWSLGYHLYWHVVPLYRDNNFANTSHNIFGNVHSFNMVGVHKDTGIVFAGAEKIVDANAHPLAG
jgi:FkbM family methyltransferase